MEKNVGGIDRVFRIIVGLFLLSLIFWGPRTWWGIIGIVPLITGLAGTCPLYTLIGFSTCPVRSEEGEKKEG